MERSQSIEKLAVALARVQQELKPAPKDSTNPHFRSKYADLVSVWETVRPVLAVNDLCVIQLPCGNANGSMSLTTMVMHTSGQFIAETMTVRLPKDDSQGAGSAITYMRRYALAALLGVVADEDDDGNAASSVPRSKAEDKKAQSYLKAIKDELIRRFPTQTEFDREAKLNALQNVFGTRSWTFIENLDAEILWDGLVKLRSSMAPNDPREAEEAEAAFQRIGEVVKDLK